MMLLEKLNTYKDDVKEQIETGMIDGLDRLMMNGNTSVELRISTSQELKKSGVYLAKYQLFLDGTHYQVRNVVFYATPRVLRENLTGILDYIYINKVVHKLDLRQVTNLFYFYVRVNSEITGEYDKVELDVDTLGCNSVGALIHKLKGLKKYYKLNVNQLVLAGNKDKINLSIWKEFAADVQRKA